VSGSPREREPLPIPVTPSQLLSYFRSIGNRADTPALLFGNSGDGCIMSPRTDDYRARAARSEERANQARDPGVKRQFEELAQQWLEMAKQADRQNW
jgi:hypothetical protein